MPALDQSGADASLTNPLPCKQDTLTDSRRPVLRVYMMDLWSFIPYYMSSLCASLAPESVKVTLGSVRYHLDRNYFRKSGLSPDKCLLDVGGGFRAPFLRRIFKSFEYVANLMALALRFSIFKPDILHVQFLPFLSKGIPFELWFLRWTRRLGIPIVYTVHNVTPQNAPERGRRLYQRGYNLADRLICHGEEAKAELTRDFAILPEKICVIPHGPLFDERPELSPHQARRLLGLPVDETLVLCCGVISEYKGIPFLLDAWKEFRQLGGKGSLLIGGNGDPRILAEIREKVLREEIGSVELWLRFIAVEQLPLLHQAADVLVYPYKAGTTSGALLTGLKYGKAIIATKLPFFREYLADGETAMMVDYGDSRAMAASLLQLTSNPEERSRLGSALLRQATEGVTWDEIARKTRDCYEKILLPSAPRQ